MYNILECNKIAFSFGEFGVAWYAIIIMLGATLAAVVVYFGYAKKLGVDGDLVISGITIWIVVGILGGRLYYVLFTRKLRYYFGGRASY